MIKRVLVDVDILLDILLERNRLKNMLSDGSIAPPPFSRNAIAN